LSYINKGSRGSIINLETSRGTKLRGQMSYINKKPIEEHIYEAKRSEN